MTKILVTGATGHVGRNVVRSLIRQGRGVVAAGLDANRVRERFGSEVEASRLDFHDRSSWPGALKGSHHMFLMRPPAISDVKKTINPFIDFARAHGVDHIVFLSVAGAGRNKIVPHRKVEDHLRALGDRHTNLRPGFFAQNLESAYRQDIVESDRIYVPAGRAPVNWIDARDIAEVASLILMDPEKHRRENYTLTGPRALRWSELCDELSSTLGRRIDYEPASVLSYVLHLSKRGLPRGAIAVQSVLHFLLRFGQGAAVDPTLARLLGRSAGTVQTYIQDHAEVWQRPSTQG